MNVHLTYAPTTKKAPDTQHSAIKEAVKKGACAKHPGVPVTKKKLFGRASCPDCEKGKEPINNPTNMLADNSPGRTDSIIIDNIVTGNSGGVQNNTIKNKHNSRISGNKVIGNGQQNNRIG